MFKPRCLSNRGKSDLCFDCRHLRKQKAAFDKVISGRLAIYLFRWTDRLLLRQHLVYGHRFWDIISLIAASVRHRGSAENSPPGAGAAILKVLWCAIPLFLNIESSNSSSAGTLAAHTVQVYPCHHQHFSFSVCNTVICCTFMRKQILFGFLLKLVWCFGRGSVLLLFCGASKTGQNAPPLAAAFATFGLKLQMRE